MSSAELWNGGQYELVAARFAEIHDALVESLAHRAGERWLDVATGTGEVTLRAARAGAEVTGLDIAPRLLEQARSRSSDVEWVDGDVQALPFPDGAFDVVSSSFGLIFAPDQELAERAAAFRAAMLEHWSQFETPEGVREPRRRLLVLGERR